MCSFKHVDSETSERLRELANRVRSTLIAAGIPAFDDASPNPAGGARIEIDAGDDEGCGVYVSWTPPREKVEKINSHLLSNQLCHESIKSSGKISKVMAEAIIAVLGVAGFSAEASRDDMRPLEVSVSG